MRALLTLLLVVVATTSCAVPGASPDDRAAVAAGRHFLAVYEDGDGRVVRRDQGGDTVSEGQGYAMLVALALGDRGRFDRAWSWTWRHLRRPDGLLSFLWRDGAVVDATPAADADLQVAWALALAARRWHVVGYRTAARTLAVAIADHEIGYDDQGRPLLAAGPWGRAGPGKAVTVEPGYWTLAAMPVLAGVTADNRWRGLEAATRATLLGLAGRSGLLPPDWARVGGGSRAEPVRSPSGAAVACGLDGQRALVWAATSRSGRSLAAAWWRRVRDGSATLSRGLDGTPRDVAVAPLGAVAAAAASGAAGDLAARDRLLALATRVAQRYPTYYGSAWLALGRLLLTTSRLS
ncbi:MAG: glycosyl hydrolase family 8 [Mycobacteriales bacterium]